MELTSEMISVLEGAILYPSFHSAIYLFFITVIGEFAGFLPITIVLVSPVAFLEGSLTFSFVFKTFFLVATPFALGTALGSLLVYGLAYFGGKPAIDKFSKYLHFSWSDVEKMEAKFQDKWYDEAVFLGLRATPFLPTLPLNIAAGLLRMNVFSYFALTALGMIIRLMLMVLVVGSSV